MRSGLWTGLGSVLAAAGSSACCWLPLAAVALGFSAGGVAAFFDQYRLPLLVVAGALLALGFYLNYRREEACGPGDGCSERTAGMRRVNRVILWISLVLVGLFAAVPGYLGGLAADMSGAAGSAVPTRLSAGSGPSAAANTPDADPARDVHGPLAGRWHAEFPMEDGTKADLHLDLGRLDGRWIGECDFAAFGLSDFNLSVVVRDSTIHLDFGGADASFDGHFTLAPPRIAGVLASQSGPIGLLFTREGEASLSEDLLRFERAPEDSARLLELSRNGRELRAAFNRDRKKTRLVVLLSPT